MKRNRSKRTRTGGAKPKQGARAQRDKTSAARKLRLGQEAEQIITRAEQLYGTADQLHQKVDSLHRWVDQVHATSAALHRRVGGAGSSAEMGALVTDDKWGRKPHPFHIVGVGASAGGYEAFIEFLSHLSKHTGMAFVLVQHLDPKHESQLTQLLAQSSKLPMELVKNGVEVEANRIYVIPENANMTLDEGRLRLSPRKEHESPPMPIDGFFRSLAHEQQHRAIAVVLSGTGTDGTLGLAAVKGEGGITFAQDERSSKFFGMPGSAIASGAADYVLSPANIAQELGRIAQHPLIRPGVKGAQPTPAQAFEAGPLLRENPEDMSALFALLRARNGVDFSLYKQTTLKRRMVRRLILHKQRTLSDYLGLVESNPLELEALFNDLLINVTSFFRDPASFQILKRKVFPRLVKGHTDKSGLRVWVCGCSSGEEAYSVAIALAEFFEQSGTRRSAQVFATDLSDGAIEKARAGIYPENIQQDVSAERLRRFFTKVNGQYQVQKSIRDMCIFARQNMLSDPPFSNLDLVSCRNVLIYFGPVLQRKIIPLFHYSLRPGGILWLGNSESIGVGAEHFEPMDKKHKVYVKKVTYRPPGFENTRRRPAVAAKAPAASRLEANKPFDLQQQLDKVLLRECSPATVVVNSQMDVVHFRGRTGLFLEHAPGGASLNLFKMVRDSLVMSVRSVVNRALRDDSSVKEGSIQFRHAGSEYEVALEAIPFRVEPIQERFVAVVFQETEIPKSAGPGSRVKGRSGSEVANLRRELARVKLDLSASKESMQSIVQDQELANEELKSANEEVQSSNEELQSTNEELETAKEELQSTNEELTTLNEELQTRNVELSHLNNDLVNLLGSVNMAIIMVGQDLGIRRFTPTAERIFNLIPADLGRRLTDLKHTLLLPDLDQVVRRAIDELAVVERETQDEEGHWYMLRTRPYRTRDNKIDGAVIVLIDIDELRRALDLVMGMVHQPLLMLGADLKVRNANPAFLETFQVRSDDVVGQFIYDISNRQWNIPPLRTLLEEVLPTNQQVKDFIVETPFPRIGLRKLRLNAGRFFEEGKGVPLVLLAIEDVTGK